MLNNSKKKNKFFLLVCFLSILFFLFFYFLGEKQKINFYNLKSQLQGNNCVVEKRQGVITGDSLSPFLENNRKITIFLNYYRCNEIKRNDVVVFKKSLDPRLIIKIVKGLPGDKFSLKKEKEKWNLFVNGEVLKNSEGKNYSFIGKRYEMLALYENDFQGKIPQKAFLVFGDNPDGSRDSSSFGFLSEENILGKVYF